MEADLTDTERTLLLLAKELGKLKQEVAELRSNQATVLEEGRWVRDYVADHSAYAELADL